MAIDRTKNPPSWHPTAVPTIYGWVAPENGELLVSIRGLENPVEYDVRTKKLGDYTRSEKVKIQAARRVEAKQPETSEKPKPIRGATNDALTKGIEDIGAALAHAQTLAVAQLPAARGRGRPKGAPNKTPEEKAEIAAKKAAKKNKDKKDA
ncbi:hypothetical protein SmaMPs15_000157 [Stenotrophomonas maltophilia phage vB_SmaM_Ps15]|uniref:Uncharacterized protein n=1 Tax=Stenotrophomonas maltophilia phage vB_SmaM_Ps15 TaxID=3071007 RepID=A0AAE9FPD5_9CAUD|nr:hypothetical protein PQC01_gp157 [Stenotrophomonas maltophilia phage vB_SmaM_Ps15]UMO77308.1 hypothetical protein SmaMPs15_000157 [Stenotrophomonas maltophilia phage vB_SmaM_Ps15]